MKKNETIEKYKEMKKLRKKDAEIIKELGINKRTFYRHIKGQNVKINRKRLIVYLD